MEPQNKLKTQHSIRDRVLVADLVLKHETSMCTDASCKVDRLSHAKD